MSINLPITGWVGGVPRIVRSAAVARAGKRAMVFVEVADPYWEIPMQTKPLDFEERADLEAFLAEAGAGTTTVILDLSYLPVPLAYRSDPANAALSNNGVLISVTNGRELEINSVTNGLDLRRGDLIGLKTDDYRSLHRVVVGGVASGNTIEVTVEPPVPPYIEEDAVVTFKNVELNTRVMPGSEEIGEEYLSQAKFTLVEVPK